MNGRVVLCGALAVLVLAAAARAGPPPLAAVVNETLSAGTAAHLPPHLAMVLGLSKNQQPVPVRQIATTTDHEVRAFNVSVANHGDLVIFTVDEQTHLTTAFLLAPNARLRKAVSYAAGAESVAMSPARARKPFARELAFWSGATRPHPFAP